MRDSKIYNRNELLCSRLKWMTHGFLNHKESTGCVGVNQRFPADFETNGTGAQASN
jgi:hypothetical protein